MVVPEKTAGIGWGMPMTNQDSRKTKPRVLFVEDEETVRDHLAQQLASEYAVETAGDGEQALLAVIRSRPDIIVTDLLMPALDGVELVKILRNTPSTATIPILMISGRAPDELRLEGFEGGADAFLAKPYTERELRGRIRSILRSVRMRSDEAQRIAHEQAEQEAVRERAALLESISDAFYAVDRHWRVTYVNQRALDYFGVSREALVGRVLWDAFPAGKGTRVEAEFQFALRNRKPAAFEMISPLSGRWIDMHVYPTPDGLAVNFRDITDRKRAEAALRDSELRFRSMANAVPVLMWRADPENRGTWFNQPWLDFTGRALEEELGYGWSDTIHPDDRARAIATCQASLEKLAPLEMEFRLRRHDGVYRWVLDRGMPVFDGPDGVFSGYIGTCVDITDRKMAEEELRKRADEFHALADNIPTLCWMAYSNGHIYWYNRRWFEYTGTDPDSQEGWGWESVHDPQVLPRVKERWKHSLESGEPFEMTFPLKAADGSFSSFLTRIVPIRDDHGTIVRWFGTNTDISAQLTIERQLRDLMATLEQRVDTAVAERKSAIEQLAHVQKMETIGQLTGGVAHDFNNLLTPIVGALDMLRRKLDGDTRAQRLTSGALQAADRARVLIQHLLAFARKQHLEARPVDINALLDSIRELLVRTLGPHVAVATEIHGPVPPARVDPNQLELALLNLALNSRDAMPTGGTVTIVAKAETIARHSSLKPGEYVSISVSDTGTGMDELTMKRAIEPFYTTKPAGQGTGLGLSMVHGLAAQSGGDLALQSALGRGTTATLLLPASAQLPEIAPSEAVAEEATKDGHTPTILIVDDEALVRFSTAAMLSDSGYQVVEAASAADALSLVEGGLDVTAVVTDYAMPGMNGVELARALRVTRPTMPILMITGFASLTDVEADGLPRLAKPFRETELNASVAALLENAVRSTA